MAVLYYVVYSLGHLQGASFFLSRKHGRSRFIGLFKRPVAWKVLHALIGCIMWYIAYGLYKEIRFS